MRDTGGSEFAPAGSGRASYLPLGGFRFQFYTSPTIEGQPREEKKNRVYLRGLQECSILGRLVPSSFAGHYPRIKQGLGLDGSPTIVRGDATRAPTSSRPLSPTPNPLILVTETIIETS